MTPEQFEHYVAELYSIKGYQTEVSPLSNDWGIDVIATKEDEKIAIQAKMYGGSTRSVNRRMIMELYGAAAYKDCTSAVLVTDGNVMSDAQLVADKLGIMILQLPSNINLSADIPCCIKTTKSQELDIKELGNYPTFDEIWEKYIMPLGGKTVSDGSLENTIISVSWASVIRKTSNDNIREIAIEGFKLAYGELIRKGEITRDYINQQVDKRCSSGIVLILSQVPFIDVTYKPKGLKLKKM